METDIILQHLRSVEIFADTPVEALAALAENTQYTSYAANHNIIKKGDQGESIYILVAGRVKVHDAEIEVAQLGEGEFFGELSLLDASPRSLSVSTMRDSELLTISRAELFKVLRTDIDILMKILHVLTERFRNQNQKRISELLGKKEELQKLVNEQTKDLKEKNSELSQALKQLRDAQEELIQKERMATIGTIASEIAHEIQNPLNFVNNFSEINLELLEELQVGVEHARFDDPDFKNDLQQLVENCQRIKQNGLRVSGIVDELLEQVRQMESARKSS